MVVVGRTLVALVADHAIRPRSAQRRRATVANEVVGITTEAKVTGRGQPVGRGPPFALTKNGQQLLRGPVPPATVRTEIENGQPGPEHDYVET